jgi:hypothetical protein
MTTIHYGHPNSNKTSINIKTYSRTGASTWTGTVATGVTGGAGSIEPGGNVKFNLFLDMLSTKYKAGRVVVSSSKSVYKLLTH